MDIETISSPVDLERIRPAWDSLLQECPHRTPFLSCEWIVNRWKHFGTGRELQILLLREDTRLVLIAPLMMQWASESRRHLKTYIYRPGSAYANLLYTMHSALLLHPLRHVIRTARQAIQ